MLVAAPQSRIAVEQHLLGAFRWPKPSLLLTGDDAPAKDDTSVTLAWFRHLEMFRLLRQRNFGLLWIAGLISVAGDGAMMTAMPLHVYQVTGSALASGAIFLAGMVPRVLVGSFAGVFVDRWDRLRTMVMADLILAALLLPLLAAQSADLLWVLFAVRAAMATVAMFFSPAENALLPQLVSADDLVAANAMNSLNDTLGRLIGPAAGGIMFATGGLGAAVAFDVVTFLIGAGLISLIRVPASASRVAHQTEKDIDTGIGRLWREWTGGLRVVVGIPGLRIIFLSFAIGLLADGSFAAGYPALMLDVMQGGPEAVGLLLSAQSIGGLIGAIMVTSLAARFKSWVLFGTGLIGAGIADFTLGNAAAIASPGTPALIVGAVALVFAGFPLVSMNAASNGIIQTITPDRFRGRVFGALGTVVSLSMLIGTATAGFLIDRIGVQVVFSGGALLWIAGGVFALIAFGRNEGATAAMGNLSESVSSAERADATGSPDPGNQRG